MFDLERAIADWRRQMLAAGVKPPTTLDELESHLREDVERQTQSGVSVEQAFEIALQRIGQPGTLQSEFAKVGATKETRRRKLKLALLRFLGFPVPAPVVLTAGAQKSLELGGREALGFHHDFIGTEHVLLGLLELEKGAVTGVLRRMGVDHRIVRNEIERFVGRGPEQRITHAPPFTPRAKKALELAGREAKAQNHARVSAEHIFLGLLARRAGDGVAVLVLKKLGVDVEAARAEVARELRWNQSGASD